MHNKYQMIEEWECMKCDLTWQVPSVPHRPECPICGKGGWWRRFLTPDEIAKMNAQFRAHRSTKNTKNAL